MTERQPILAVEYTARVGDNEYKEESVPLHSPEELFEFVAPGGGCESIPSEVGEINMVFLAPHRANAGNPLMYATATLQLGMVFLTGPLSEIVQVADQMLDKAGRDELSGSFLTVIGAAG